jgi:hypothetical protein
MRCGRIKATFQNLPGAETWMDSLDERPKRWNMDMRLERGMLEDCIGQVH